MTIYVFVLGMINDKAIGTESHIEIPEQPVFSNSTWENVGVTTNFMSDSIGYYLDLFFMNDYTGFITIFIIVPATLVAVFIFITEVLIPFIVAIGGLIPFT